MMQNLNPSNQIDVSASNKPVISACNLNHYFGDGELRKQVLFEINLDINPGEIVIMTGPSGSGKTTLLTLMGGLRSAQSGSLKILEQEICGASKQQMMYLRRQIGYIFQAHNLLTFLTAKQNVRMSLELHDDRLARALVSRPKIILADEPTAALDKKSGRDVVEMMQKLAKQQGCTILLVTHDNRILDIADRIVLMEDGRLTKDNAL
ncbi:MAG: ATP-binding cassette domain-containing protein [Oscillatoriales cyanobacterium]|nr:MAG: ATP-binding cassette domain-containing protein [Oscillatoriales cyanobacterium]